VTAMDLLRSIDGLPIYWAVWFSWVFPY
jgi:hypothetical protein